MTILCAVCANVIQRLWLCIVVLVLTVVGLIRMMMLNLRFPVRVIASMSMGVASCRVLWLIRLGSVVDSDVLSTERL